MNQTSLTLLVHRTRNQPVGLMDLAFEQQHQPVMIRIALILECAELSFLGFRSLELKVWPHCIEFPKFVLKKKHEISITSGDLYTYMCVYIYTGIYMYKYIYIYICIYIYVYVYYGICTNIYAGLFSSYAGPFWWIIKAHYTFM